MAPVTSTATAQATDPTNTGSVFRVISVADVGSPGVGLHATRLLWAAIPGRLYRLQTKSDDVSGPWTDVPGDVRATGTSATKLHITPFPGPSHSFYRVQLIP